MSSKPKDQDTKRRGQREDRNLQTSNDFPYHIKGIKRKKPTVKKLRKRWLSN